MSKRTPFSSAMFICIDNNAELRRCRDADRHSWHDEFLDQLTKPHQGGLSAFTLPLMTCPIKSTSDLPSQQLPKYPALRSITWRDCLCLTP